MLLIPVLLFPVIYGLSSSDMYSYQITSIKPKQISITNEEGSINVTVKYDHDSLVFDSSSYWLINGRYIADGEDNIRVKFSKTRGIELTNTGVSYQSDDPPDDYEKMASILIPVSLRVSSLQLQIVSDVFEINIDINVLQPSPGKTLIEKVPEYKMELDPKNRITYESGDPLQFRVSFSSKDMVRTTADDVTAEFTGIDQCTSPARLEKKNSDEDREFITVWVPTRDNRLTLDEMFSIDQENYVVRRVNVTYSNNSALPRGLLKISGGYHSRSSCWIFSGVKVTMYSFLQPPPHSDSDFFPLGTFAFLMPATEYFVDYGDNLDITVTAFGGRVENNQYGTAMISSPEISVRKRRQNVPIIADVKRLLQREVTIRIKNATQEASGRYVATARIGRSRFRRDFNVFVRNGPAACG